MPPWSVHWVPVLHIPTQMTWKGTVRPLRLTSGSVLDAMAMVLWSDLEDAVVRFAVGTRSEM